MREVEKVFLETISRESMFPRRSRITLAVSGGADSVAMLYLVKRFADVRDWNVSVLHIDHGLRQDSFSDAQFVGDLSAEMDLPFECRQPDSNTGGSMESRWSAIRQKIYLEQPDFVSVAHTASDRAETVLMRLFEGSGLRGLGGMDYNGVGPVRRPMLDLQGLEIRSWLKKKNYSWIQDSSNRDTDILRNRLRLEVMPVIAEHFPEAVSGICRSGGLLSGWRDLQNQLSEFAGNDRIRIDELLALPEVLGTMILWNMAGKPRKGYREINKILDWLDRGGTGSHILPGGKRLVAEGDLVIVESRGRGRY